MLSAVVLAVPCPALLRILPPAVRDAFLSGQWNPTAMLLDRFDQVREVAARVADELSVAVVGPHTVQELESA